MPASEVVMWRCTVGSGGEQPQDGETVSLRYFERQSMPPSLCPIRSIFCSPKTDDERWALPASRMYPVNAEAGAIEGVERRS